VITVASKTSRICAAVPRLFEWRGDWGFIAMSEAVLGASRPQKTPFAPYHKWDRDFFITWVVLIWVGIVMGFGTDMIRHFQTHERAYPLIVHFHAAAFVGWMVVLTTQVLLIRTRRHDLHRRLGFAAMGLAAAMIVLGPLAAIITQRLDFGTPHSDPSFVAIQFGGITAFATLAGAAFLLRGNSSAHKRLILLATLSISSAGFARWLGGPLHALLGHGFWPSYAGPFLATDLLIIGLGAYDFITRRRLHPAYVIGATWIIALELTENFLYLSPAWKPIALKLIGH
jgi:uncharacterized membrane protein YozB (DUF420 family)